MSSTRRGFIAGALASTALPGVARGAESAPGPLQAKQKIVRGGRAIAGSRGAGRLVIAHAQRRTIASLLRGRSRSRTIDVGGQPVEVAVSPDGRLAAVTTGFWDEPGLAIVDLATGAVAKRVKLGPAPFGVAFTTDGKRIVVTGGEQEGSVHVLEVDGLAVVGEQSIGRVPRGVAPEPGGDAAWIALCANDQVVRVELPSGRVTAALDTPQLPDRIAVSPDARRLLVTHDGRDAEHVSDVAIESGRVTRERAGRLPSAVAWTQRGGRLVALGGAGEIVSLGAGGRRRRHDVGGSPRGLVVAGDRAWTVDALGGAIRAVRV